RGGHRYQDMRTQARPGRMRLALEADDRTENARQHEPDGDDVLGQISIDQAETIADFHEPHPEQEPLQPNCPSPLLVPPGRQYSPRSPPGRWPDGGSQDLVTQPSRICSLTSLGRASTARSNALIESSKANV